MFKFAKYKSANIFSFQLLLIALLITTSGCSHVVWRSYKTAMNDSIQIDTSGCDVAFVRIHPNDSIAENIGQIELSDLGVSFICSEKDVINFLNKEACNIGAQIVLIKNIKRPNVKSYCFRCTAVLYRLKYNASMVATNKYFEEERIYKRSKKDTKGKIARTFYILANIRYIIYAYNQNVEMYNRMHKDK